MSHGLPYANSRIIKHLDKKIFILFFADNQKNVNFASRKKSIKDMKIKLELDIIQAVLLRDAIDNQIEELRFSDCDDDAIDMHRLCEIRNSLDKEIRNS